MSLFEVNELGLKARLSDLLCHSFKHTISYLIAFPLMRGEGGSGFCTLSQNELRLKARGSSIPEGETKRLLIRGGFIR